MEPDEVYLVSYPRSGNTWLRLLLATVQDPSQLWTVQSVDRIIPDMYRVDVRQLTPPRIIKSHEPFSSDYRKVVYLYRDGRDVALSYYDFYRTVWSYRGNWQSFLARYVAGRVYFGAWHHHVASWLGQSADQRLLKIRYEDLCKNPLPHLKAIAGFIGLKTNRRRLIEAIHTCTWEAYRKDIVSDPENVKTGYQGGVSGKPGKWREVFKADELEMFWNVAGATMTQLNYSHD